MGNMKLRRRQYFVGISGLANVASRQTNTTPMTTAATPATVTPTEVQPATGPMLSTSMAEVTPPAKLQLPTQSMPSHMVERRFPAASDAPSAETASLRARRLVGSNAATTSEAMINSTS